ncbi:uncharacterized protein LOC103145005 [Poecilia formosa]|uniref:uncharacterized protein LOC103145005 n=1 Tax=Poecilia formosa TaxID=48698 RepID=UPI0007B9E583|nr:PREDICTED: uncharacterized protein LOC103145005 [Poecilia formosa]
MAPPKSMAECPLYFYKFRYLGKHLIARHSIRNLEERKILINLGSRRVNIRGLTCPIPGCGYARSRLDTHLSQTGHPEMEVGELVKVVEQVKRDLTVKLLRELRATNPVPPLLSSLDLDPEQEEMREAGPSCSPPATCSNCHALQAEVIELQKKLRIQLKTLSKKKKRIAYLQQQYFLRAGSLPFARSRSCCRMFTIPQQDLPAGQDPPLQVLGHWQEAYLDMARTLAEGGQGGDDHRSVCGELHGVHHIFPRNTPAHLPGVEAHSGRRPQGALCDGLWAGETGGCAPNTGEARQAQAPVPKCHLRVCRTRCREVIPRLLDQLEEDSSGDVMRRFFGLLSLYICSVYGHRTGVLQNMTVLEVAEARSAKDEELDEGFLINVKEHKTNRAFGSAQVFLTPEEFRWIERWLTVRAGLDPATDLLIFADGDKPFKNLLSSVQDAWSELGLPGAPTNVHSYLRK